MNGIIYRLGVRILTIGRGLDSSSIKRVGFRVRNFALKEKVWKS